MLAMLPAFVGQLYLIGMVWGGFIDYVQVGVAAMVEVLVVQLISALFLSPNAWTLRNRLGEFIVLAICEAMVLSVLLLMPSSGSSTQFHDALAALAGVRTSYIQMFVYLGLVLGGSCVAAFAGGNANYSWYRNVTSQAGVIFFALFLSALLVAPVGYIVTRMHLSTGIFATAWTALYGTVRLLLSYGMSAWISPESMQTKYATYAAGVPAPPKRKIDYKSRALGLPFFLVGAAIVTYAFFSWRSDDAYGATALRADGVIVDVLNYLTRENHDVTAAVIEFNDADGKKIRLKTPKIPGTQWYHVNAHVTMLYQPGHPEDARVENVGNSNAFPYVVGVFGLIALSIGLLVMFSPMVDTVVKDDGGGEKKNGFAVMDRTGRQQSDA